MSPTIRNVVLVAGITMLTMWAVNQAAARNATVRRFIKGGPVALATSGGQAV